MENELLKQINLKGIKSKILSMKLTGEIVLDFSMRCFRLIREFAAIKKKKKTPLIQYFLKHLERFFKGGRIAFEGALSRFLSVMSLHKMNGEVELYYQMFYNNIGHKVASLFMKFFVQISNLQYNLYDRPNKLLKDIKINIKRALELGAYLLKDDFSITNFSNALSKYFESRRSTHNVISADILAQLLLSSYVIGRNYSDREKRKEGGIFLNWNAKDPQMFQIEVEKVTLEKQVSQKMYIDLKSQKNGPEDLEHDMNQINYDFVKKQRKEQEKKKNAPLKSNSKKSNGLNKNLIRICSKYVFEEAPYHPSLEANPFPHLSNKTGLAFLGSTKLNKFASARNFNVVTGGSLKQEDGLEEDIEDQELKFLTEKLEASKKQLSIQKNLWKLVLHKGKDSIRNYRDLKSEMDTLEGINDVLLSLVDKNTQQWKELALIKNSGMEELGKYKFLIATLLEDCSVELNKDISDFKFAGNENMNLVSNAKKGFDMYEYLNGKNQLNSEDFTYNKEIKLKSIKLSKKQSEHFKDLEGDRKQTDKYDSLIEDLNQFPDHGDYESEEKPIFKKKKVLPDQREDYLERNSEHFQELTLKREPEEPENFTESEEVEEEEQEEEQPIEEQLQQSVATELSQSEEERQILERKVQEQIIDNLQKKLKMQKQKLIYGPKKEKPKIKQPIRKKLSFEEQQLEQSELEEFKSISEKIQLESLSKGLSRLKHKMDSENSRTEESMDQIMIREANQERGNWQDQSPENGKINKMNTWTKSRASYKKSTESCTSTQI